MVDSVALYDETTLKCSKIITHQYSDSFRAAVQSLDKKLQMPLYGIYGFVRVADEIVDTFHDKDKRLLLDKLKKDTFEAIDTGISLNPVLHAFQLVVNKYKIDLSIIDTFLHSMEMDLDLKSYDKARFNEYLEGAAEAVALMALHVFCEGDRAVYELVQEPARKLGNAFQKVNFLRDMSSDYHERGRVYFPGVDFTNFNIAAKTLIEEDIEIDFKGSLSGIEQLPEAAKKGVRVAYLFYRKLFHRIKASTPEKILNERIRVNNFEKLCILLMNNYFYLSLVLLIISCPLAFSFDARFHYASKWYALFPAILISASFFIAWDIWFTRVGMWRFNTRYLSGTTLLHLPLEEWLFFFTVPYSCVFIYEAMVYFFPADIFAPVGKVFMYCLIPLLLGIAISNARRRYTLVNSLVAVAVIGLHLIVFKDRLLGRYVIAFAVHLIPFFLCNGLLTGGGPMEEPVVIYNDDHNLGFRIGTIPVEDVVYSMTLLLMNVSIFEAVQDIWR